MCCFKPFRVSINCCKINTKWDVIQIFYKVSLMDFHFLIECHWRFLKYRRYHSYLCISFPRYTHFSHIHIFLKNILVVETSKLLKVFLFSPMVLAQKKHRQSFFYLFFFSSSFTTSIFSIKFFVGSFRKKSPVLFLL